MPTSTLIRSARTLIEAIDEIPAARGGVREARRLMHSLLKCIASGAPSPSLLAFAKTRHGLGRRVAALHRAVAAQTVASALYRHFIMRQSRPRAIRASGSNATDVKFAIDLADRVGVDIRDVLALVDKSQPWIAAIRGEAERMEIFLDQRAAEDMLLAALEAYSVPRTRRRKYEEVYGICVGSVRSVETLGRGTGIAIDTYVNVTRCATQLRAEGTASTVYPNDDSFRVQIGAAKALFPQLEIVGDFHSHPYPTVGDMTGVTGWWYSDADQIDNRRWVKQMAEAGYRARVAFIVAVARKSRARPDTDPQRHGPHTHRITIENHHFVIGAYRTLQDGTYSADRTRLHCQAANVS